MTDYKEERPEKEVFPSERQEEIKEEVKEFVNENLIPHLKINKIVLFGSLAKGEFGKYEEKYQDRIYSDVDLLLMVENDFKVPEDWEIHFEGRPELEGDLYKAYFGEKLEDKFLLQYMVCRKKSYTSPKNKEIAEGWGVPLKLEESKLDYEIIYEKKES